MVLSLCQAFTHLFSRDLLSSFMPGAHCARHCGGTQVIYTEEKSGLGQEGDVVSSF